MSEPGAHDEPVDPTEGAASEEESNQDQVQAEREAMGMVPAESTDSSASELPSEVAPEADAEPPALPSESAFAAVADSSTDDESEPVSELAEEPKAKPARKRAAPSEAPDLPPEPAPSEPKGDWYAVRVQSNKEDSVRRNMVRRIEMRGLQRKISEIVVPTEKVAEIKNGKKRTRQVKTYPGYVLVRMMMDDETWAFVRETGGVGDFVGGGSTSDQKPFPLRQEEVNKIFGIEAPGVEPETIKIDFGRGDKVKIREGPFENFDGVVEEIDETKGKVKVVVTIFGRATPVELQYWQVELI